MARERYWSQAVTAGPLVRRARETLPTASLSVQASEWREGASAAAEPNTGSTAGVGQYSSVVNKIKGVIPGTWARPCLSVVLKTCALVGARALPSRKLPHFSPCHGSCYSECCSARRKATWLINAVHKFACCTQVQSSWGGVQSCGACAQFTETQMSDAA